MSQGKIEKISGVVYSPLGALENKRDSYSTRAYILLLSAWLIPQFGYLNGIKNSDGEDISHVVFGVGFIPGVDLVITVGLGIVEPKYSYVGLLKLLGYSFSAYYGVLANRTEDSANQLRAIVTPTPDGGMTSGFTGTF